MMDDRQRERAALGVHLSVSGQRGRILEDGFSEHGYVLNIGDAEQSHVDAADATVVFYEYLRRIANVLDVLTLRATRDGSAPGGRGTHACPLCAGHAPGVFASGRRL